MTEHLNLTDLIMKRSDFDLCPPSIKLAIELYAEATELIENGFINEGHMREREAFEVLRESGSKQKGADTVLTKDSQINEPYIPREFKELL